MPVKEDNPSNEASDPWSQLPQAAAPPQANGELLFDAPWQGRAFGMVHTLVDAGRFSWDEFREHLIVALDGGAASADVYYERLLLALERSLAKHKGLDALDSAEITQRADELAARPHGHDH